MRLDALAEAVGGEVLRTAAADVRRLGLALDPWDGLGRWAAREACDAVLLHRSYELGEVPEGLGVVGTHDAFDAALPWRLATALGLGAVAAFEDRGVVGEGTDDVVGRLSELLGAVEVLPGHAAGARVAVMGAMTDPLVRAAADAGVATYVTGQGRPRAAEAVAETGMTVVLTGHLALERWGLGDLAASLQDRHGIDTVLAPDGAS